MNNKLDTEPSSQSVDMEVGDKEEGKEILSMQCEKTTRKVNIMSKKRMVVAQVRRSTRSSKQPKQFSGIILTPPKWKTKGEKGAEKESIVFGRGCYSQIF